MKVNVRIIPHARERMIERGVTEEEVILTIEKGKRLPARLGRVKFIYEVGSGSTWKRVEVIAEQEGDAWCVITVIAKYPKAL